MSLRPPCAFALLLAACNLVVYDDVTGATGGGGTSGAATTSGTTTGGTELTSTTTVVITTGTGAATTSTTGTTSTGGTDWNFISPLDLGPLAPECDFWEQDCRPGQKCLPVSSIDGTPWDTLRCIDIVADPDAMYEPCMAFGSGLDAADTCDAGLMCWFVDFETDMGVCLGLCGGSPGAPQCADPNVVCPISDSISLLCFPSCDPLEQLYCWADSLCVPHWNDPYSWICVDDASGDEGQAFDPCEYTNACDQGLFCADPDFAAECDPDALGCCDPLCDLTQPNTCPGQGQECLPWYEVGDAPAGLDDLGYCGLP